MAPPLSPKDRLLPRLSASERLAAGRPPTEYPITPLIEAMPRDDPFIKQVVTGDPLSGRKATAPRKEEEDEWDASKTPPSQFQKRKGSIYATQGSRDGHVEKNTERDARFHATLVEKGWAKMASSRRGSADSRGEKGSEEKGGKDEKLDTPGKVDKGGKNEKVKKAEK